MGMKKSTKAWMKKQLIQAVSEASPRWCAPFSSKVRMVAASCYLPKDDEKKPLGEDAHFISDDEQKIGVADGVGAWTKKGIDAGIYARELMMNALVELEDQPDHAVNPWAALNEAFLCTEARGSSTACLVTLRGLGDFLGDILHAVNVGDSGFLIIRDGKVMFQTPIQQHRFNCPYQLGKSSSKDTPESAQVFLVQVEAGDIVVVGTDGLFDNLFPHEIVDIVRICRQRENAEEVMAKAIANAARQISLLQHSSTPFNKAAMEAGFFDSPYAGGKYDDITVIVAQIV